jgi:membrane protease YdiL (CAAX protease family)
MSPYFLMAITPVALIGFTALGAHRMRLRADADLGLQAPAPGPALLWLLGFAALSVLVEFAGPLLGTPDEAGAWRGKYAGAALLSRIAFIALLYPIAEELFFRGLVFGRVARSHGPYAAIAVSALVFALIHLQYDWRGMLLIGVDALFYGVCRWRTGSVYLTMLMHIAGNSYAVWQRLQ